MHQALEFHDFQVDPHEHQLEPHDSAAATYRVSNRCECTVITSIEITHVERTDVEGNVTLRCVPQAVTLPGPLGPNESRQISVELITNGELPGRHALRVRASYDCRPVDPQVDGLLEFTVSAD